MSEHEKLAVNSYNKILKAVKGQYIMEGLSPMYGEDYMTYRLLKDPLTNPTPTEITIKKDGCLLITINRETEIPDISSKQRFLTKETAYPNQLRIEVGCKDVDKFLKQMEGRIADYF